MLSFRPGSLAHHLRWSFAKHLIKTAALLVVPFLATLLAIWLLWNSAVHWSDLLLLTGMYTVVAFGVMVGFHRKLTHRSAASGPIPRCERSC